MTIAVLRMGHRPARDKRVTTHVALTARVFGADAVLVSTKDARLEKTIRAMASKFGGPFEIRTGVPWREAIKGWRGTVVHLTMYGGAKEDALPPIPGGRDLPGVVGAEEVPPAGVEPGAVDVSVR